MLYRSTTSILPLRSEPSDRGEMISELLYGESFTVTEENDKWLKVKCSHDGYEGWLAKEYEPEASTLESHNLHTVPQECFFELPGSGSIRLSPGSKVSDSEYNGLTKLHSKPKSELLPSDHILQFLNTPYVWGGRSIWGIDCSGLMQVVLAISGIEFPRDAYQQVSEGESIDLIDRQIGDLAFFKNKTGRIVHVGMLLSDDKIIHASGRVRIDHFDSEGIVRNSDQKRTHSLHTIKRVNT